jgi:hypothetical protein
MLRILLTALCAISLSGCATLFGPPTLPKSLGESDSGFGYVPLDALAVEPQGGCATSPHFGPLLPDLPDLSVRFAVGSFDANGGLAFGPAKVTAAGSAYRVVLDYVNVDVIPVEFRLRKMIAKGDGAAVPVQVSQPIPDGWRVLYYEAKIIGETRLTEQADEALKAASYEQVVIPVYVGIGMRLSADIRALKGGLTLTSLSGIGADAQANRISGTLTVQTLGINGKSVATALPLPSKLDQTTVENGILAIGSSRAFLYGSPSSPGDVTTTPRIVGLYTPVGSDPDLINAIYSELSRKPPVWKRPCHPA